MRPTTVALIVGLALQTLSAIAAPPNTFLLNRISGLKTGQQDRLGFAIRSCRGYSCSTSLNHIQTSCRAQMLFPSPFVFETHSDATGDYHPGDDIRIDAYVVDSRLGILTGLWKRTGSGQASAQPLERLPKARYAEVTGRAVLRNAAGRQIGGAPITAAGGRLFYRWMIPRDLQLADGRETFTIEFAMETGAL